LVFLRVYAAAPLARLRRKRQGELPSTAGPPFSMVRVINTRAHYFVDAMVASFVLRPAKQAQVNQPVIGWILVYMVNVEAVTVNTR